MPTNRTVLTKAVLRSAHQLGLSHTELALVLGTRLETVSRMATGEYLLDELGKEWELATLFVRLYRGLSTIYANDQAALRSWMRCSNTDLHANPIDRIITISGLVETVAYVDANQAPM